MDVNVDDELMLWVELSPLGGLVDGQTLENTVSNPCMIRPTRTLIVTVINVSIFCSRDSVSQMKRGALKLKPVPGQEAFT